MMFDDADPRETLLALILLVIIPILLGVGFISLACSRDTRQSRQVQSTIPRWTQAYNRWNQLYYCARDDTVFNPDNGGISMMISDMFLYLYS